MKKMTHTVKTRYALSLILMAILLVVSYTANAQVAITTDGSPADAAAMLDVKSTHRGLLLPRMTAAQRDAIANPAAGLIIYCTNCHEVEMYNGMAWVNMANGAASPPFVVNPATGKTWMYRNLGASQVATSSTDAAAYGDLYQWGRAADGHEKRTSYTTTTVATTPVPNGGNAWDSKFIINYNSPYDWLSTQDDNLWQGVNGTNNPCPAGFRLPTDTEWTAEFATWSSQDAAGAFASPLKLTVGGARYFGNGALSNVGSNGYYWSSTVSGSDALILRLNSTASLVPFSRTFGYSVRCIKD